MPKITSNPHLETITVVGTGSYVPERILTNEDLSRMVDTSDEWITSRTGIKERHIAADGELTSTMGAIAARRALDDALSGIASLPALRPFAPSYCLGVSL